jgi:hypothetical protein
MSSGRKVSRPAFQDGLWPPGRLILQKNDFNRHSAAMQARRDFRRLEHAESTSAQVFLVTRCGDEPDALTQDLHLEWLRMLTFLAIYGQSILRETKISP